MKKIALLVVMLLLSGAPSLWAGAVKTMDKEELKQQYKLRDRTVRAMSKDGKFRVAAIKRLEF